MRLQRKQRNNTFAMKETVPYENFVYKYVISELGKLGTDERIVDGNNEGWLSWKKKAQDFVVCTKTFRSLFNH